jgi:transcriptional regulator with XRE-family HTH domain
MTQKQLADALGFAPRYIAQIEQGVKGPSLDKLVEICRYFGISMADILPVEEDNTGSKERWINEIVDGLKAFDINRIGMVKAMVYYLSD